jgi:hypothetical protein
MATSPKTESNRASSTELDVDVIAIYRYQSEFVTTISSSLARLSPRSTRNARQRRFSALPELSVVACRATVTRLALCVVLLVAVGCSNDSPIAQWPSDFEARRLLSDATWVWCSDNPDDVSDVADSLGLTSTAGDWASGDAALDFYRACTTAAEARGSVELDEPAERYIAVARQAGFVNPDAQVLRTALEACSTFDESDVNEFSVDIAIHNVSAVLGQVNDDDFASEVLVGAASTAVCPEYAERVAAFG